VYVKDQLGHHAIQITVDTYGHLVHGGNRQTVDSSMRLLSPRCGSSGVKNRVETIRQKIRLRGRKLFNLLARPEGFEPPTPRFVVWCSVQLSYGRLENYIETGTPSEFRGTE
jgi:hypothetical protein